MAKKKKVLPDEIQQIIDEVKEKELQEDIQEARELVQQVRTERANSADYWDVKKEDKIEVFDPTLSYELTGYRPIKNASIQRGIKIFHEENNLKKLVNIVHIYQRVKNIMSFGKSSINDVSMDIQ